MTGILDIMVINWNILSKYRNELYGISILWIILFHGLQFKKFDIFRELSGFKEIIKHGNIGVEIFLFMSGVCLYYSMKKERNIFKFYKKRFKKILIPFLLIDGLYWFCNCIILRHDIFTFIKNITFYSFWTEGMERVWFIALIVPLYIFYPLLFKYVLNNNKINSLTYIMLMCGLVYVICGVLKYFAPQYFNMIEIALTRIPVFLLGSYCGILVYEGKEISSRTKLITFFAVIIGIMYFNYHFIGFIKSFRIPYLFIGISLTIWICIFLEAISNSKLNRLLSAWGGLSLELYLVHIILIEMFILSPLYGVSAVANFNKYVIFVLFGSYIISRFVVYIQEKIILKVNYDNK